MYAQESDSERRLNAIRVKQQHQLSKKRHYVTRELTLECIFGSRDKVHAFVPELRPILFYGHPRLRRGRAVSEIDFKSVP